jgi:hypothetical protein
MVLFLVRPAAQKSADRQEPRQPAWLPASYAGHGGFKVSVAWIEDGEAFAFIQVINPGPSVLTSAGTEQRMRACVAEFGGIQAQLEQALQQQDPGGAATAYRAFTKARFYYASKGSLQLVAEMGMGALPALRPLLADDSLSAWHDEIIDALAAAGGSRIAPEIVAIIGQELAFWQRRAPELKKGWWNADPAGERKLLRERYGKLLHALRALRSLRHAPARGVVSKVRRCWASHEALYQVGLRQMVRACDDVLRELPGGQTQENGP